MLRCIEYRITSEDIPQASFLTIRGYLKGKGYSTQNLKQLKQDPSGILLDAMPAHLNKALSTNDQLTVNIQEDSISKNIVPIALPLDILYEDQDLLVINKPAGMPIHPSQNNHDNTLANALAHYYLQKGEPFIFRCINRLDRDTSGLTLVAKHFVSAGILGSMVASKSSLTREYLAIVRGDMEPLSGTIDAPLGRKPGSIIERCVDYENGEKAITHYQVIGKKNGYSLLSLILETGRTHQIRIHLKHAGHPLIGDYLYNPDYEGISRQALHSHSLTFQHPITREAMSFLAPLPEDMARLLR